MLDKELVRCVNYMLAHGCNIRYAASLYGVSKSLLHQKIHKRLPDLDRGLYYKICDLLEYNFSDKHNRGGRATAKLYRK